MRHAFVYNPDQRQIDVTLDVKLPEEARAKERALIGILLIHCMTLVDMQAKASEDNNCYSGCYYNHLFLQSGELYLQIEGLVTTYTIGHLTLVDHPSEPLRVIDNGNSPFSFDIEALYKNILNRGNDAVSLKRLYQRDEGLSYHNYCYFDLTETTQAYTIQPKASTHINALTATVIKNAYGDEARQKCFSIETEIARKNKFRGQINAMIEKKKNSLSAGQEVLRMKLKRKRSYGMFMFWETETGIKNEIKLKKHKHDMLTVLQQEMESNGYDVISAMDAVIERDPEQKLFELRHWKRYRGTESKETNGSEVGRLFQLLRQAAKDENSRADTRVLSRSASF